MASEDVKFAKLLKLFFHCTFGDSELVSRFLGSHCRVGIEQEKQSFLGITELYTELYTELSAESYTELPLRFCFIRVVARLLDSLMRLQCLEYLAQHKVNERTRIAFGGAGGNGIVICLLT